MIRLERLRKGMEKERIPALLLTNPTNIGYLTGFVGSEDAALITPQKAILITDSRYLEEAKKKIAIFRIKKRKGPLFKTLTPLLAKLKVQRLGFEAEHLSYSRHRTLSKNLKGIKLLSARGLVENLRRIKDRGEIGLIREAVKISQETLSKIVKSIRLPIEERELSALLEYELKRAGAEGNAFPPMVAFGRRTSFPHSKPSLRKLKRGDLVLIDYGVAYRGYCSDLTRTFVLGKATTKQKRIYSLLHRAQDEAIGELKPGVRCSRIDRVARRVITAGGYGEYFSHGLGHGVGREVHEGPYLKSGDNTPLEPGMVLTVEPGIYIPGWGGMRLEDIILITEKGYEVLSKRAPTELPEL